MTEQEQAETEAVAEPATETNASEAIAHETPSTESQERNWREVRDRQKEQQNKIKELERQLQERESLPEPEMELEDDEDLLTRGELKKLFRQREQETLDERLSSKYTDFNAVVSPENIELLNKNEPELALSIKANTNPYSQAVAAYKMIKKLGIHEDPDTSKDKAKLAENSSKPMSSSSSKGTPLSQAHNFSQGLTKDLKRQLWSEMREAKKSY